MGPKRILIIDDEQPFSEMLKLNLEQVGKYVALEENDARRALATARQFNPDLVLLDVMMPDMDGGDVAAMLATDGELRDVPIIFLTALDAQEEVPSGGMSNRQHRMVPKSTPIDALIRIIETEIAGSSLTRR
jgi:CheY-like chemotaxis protein